MECGDKLLITGHRCDQHGSLQGQGLYDKGFIIKASWLRANMVLLLSD